MLFLKSGYIDVVIEAQRTGIDKTAVRRRLQEANIGGNLGGNLVLGNSVNGDRPICIEKCGGKSEPPVE
jgi:hypothetical protein